MFGLCNEWLWGGELRVAGRPQGIEDIMTLWSVYHLCSLRDS